MESTKLQTLDITVNEDNIAQGALQVLKILRPLWEEKDVKFMNFTEGITNKLIGCYHSSDTEKEDAIVMRIYGAKTELIIDREKELINMQILHAAGCAAPCFARFKNGIAYGFVSGICLDEATVRLPEIYRCITRSIAALHLVDPSTLTLASGEHPTLDTSPCLFTKARRYISLIPDDLEDPNKNEQLKKNLPSKETLFAELDRMEEALTKLGSPSVFSHNDLLLKNIVYNKSKGTATFIDYEYGAYNFEAFDIGNHFAEWAGVDDLDFNRYPTREEQLPWLRSYLEHKADLSGDKTPVTDKDVDRFYAQVNKFALMGHFFWGVWALIQASISTIDFDYLGYAKLKLDEFFKRRDEFLAIEMPA